MDVSTMGYANLSCQMLGLKLMQAAKLPEEDAGRQLLTVAREIRESLITLGMRKRKSRKTVSETPAPKRGRKA